MSVDEWRLIDRRVIEVREIIDERFREPLTGADFDQPTIGRRHLYRLFKAATGMSVSAYLRRRRLTEATRLLAETFEKINQVARKSGFQDPDYFHRVFKDVYGITPGQFRDRIQRGLFVVPRKR